jgi:prevent-host-death family protein
LNTRSTPGGSQSVVSVFVTALRDELLEPRCGSRYAKNRLSQVLQDAAQQGPQVITSHGREAAYVLSPQDYHALTRAKNSLVEFFRSSPLAEQALDMGRPEEAAGVMDL